MNPLLRAALFLLAASILLAGCFEAPTADQFDDMVGHPDPPMRRDAPTCADYFYSAKYWTPADSGTICPSGYTSAIVGFAVAPLDGKCSKGFITLYKFRQLYGCFRVVKPSVNVDGVL
jgi:hypothetical protein